MGRLVLDQHRPTLPELARSAPRWVQVLALVAAFLVIAAMIATRVESGEPDQAFVHRGSPQFNFVYGDRLTRRAPARDEIVALEERRGALFVQSFAVRQIDLPAYNGDVGGILPIVGERELAALEDRFTDFELLAEGKARINEVAGYSITFQAREGERRLYGRVILLPEPVQGSRDAVALELLGTPVSGVSRAQDVGTNAVLRPPLRSFRFGTERP